MASQFKITDYKKIVISHYGKIASNTLAQTLANATKRRRTSIKSTRPYDEFILTTGLTKITQISEYVTDSTKADSKDAKVTKLKEIEVKPRKVLVITVCRNSINRLISMYFQIHEKTVLNHSSEEILKKIDFSGRSFSSLDNFPVELVKNLNLGFNPYDELRKLSKDEKYLFRSGKSIDFLLLKYENIKEWPTILDKIFGGLPNLKLVDRNLSEDKPYKQLYAKVLEDVKLKEDIIKAYQKTNHYNVLGL